MTDLQSILLFIGLFAFIILSVTGKQIMQSINRNRLKKTKNYRIGKALVIKKAVEKTNRVTGINSNIPVWDFQMDLEIFCKGMDPFYSFTSIHLNHQDHPIDTIFGVGTVFDVEFNSENTSELYYDVDKVPKKPESNDIQKIREGLIAQYK